MIVTMTIDWPFLGFQIGPRRATVPVMYKTLAMATTMVT